MDLNLKNHKVSFMQESINPYPDPYSNRVKTKTHTLWERLLLLLLAVCKYTHFGYTNRQVVDFPPVKPEIYRWHKLGREKSECLDMLELTGLPTIYTLLRQHQL